MLVVVRQATVLPAQAIAGAANAIAATTAKLGPFSFKYPATYPSRTKILARRNLAQL